MLLKEHYVFQSLADVPCSSLWDLTLTVIFQRVVLLPRPPIALFDNLMHSQPRADHCVRHHVRSRVKTSRPILAMLCIAAQRSGSFSMGVNGHEEANTQTPRPNAPKWHGGRPCKEPSEQSTHLSQLPLDPCLPQCFTDACTHHLQK